MSMPKSILAIPLLVQIILLTSASADSGFGVPASAEDIERVYLSVGTDGENLPEGEGTAAEGKPLFDLHCAACHGFEGEGTLSNQLVGGRGTLDHDTPVKTVGSYWPYATTVFNYIRRSMPYTAPMSLTNDNYYALSAYLLNKNDIIAADTVINKESLPGIRMPNRGS